VYAELIPPDPRSAHRRGVVAARRAGIGNKCACGELRPEALISGRVPAVCFSCDRERLGWKKSDRHHLFGAANSPVTVSGPVNDHRACLSVWQQRWPQETLKNQYGSPLLAAAAKIRGFSDFVLYLMNEHLLPIAQMLELLDTTLRKKRGTKYWKKLKLEAFEPESDK
jgi:hypothetical protein